MDEEIYEVLSMIQHELYETRQLVKFYLYNKYKNECVSDYFKCKPHIKSVCEFKDNCKFDSLIENDKD